jgi:hypothetical protein
VLSQGPVGTAAVRDAWTLSQKRKGRQVLRQTKPVTASEGRRTTRLASSRTGYVAKEKMWRTGQNTPPLLGFSGFLRHILLSTRRARERVEWPVFPDVGYFRNAFRSPTNGPSAWRENTTARGNKYLNTPARFPPNEVGDDFRGRNKMWPRKSGNPNKCDLSGPLRHIFYLATYRIRLSSQWGLDEMRAPLATHKDSGQTCGACQVNCARRGSIRCIALAGTSVGLASVILFFFLPPSCVPWLRARYALPRYYGRSDSCRAVLRALRP